MMKSMVASAPTMPACWIAASTVACMLDSLEFIPSIASLNSALMALVRGGGDWGRGLGLAAVLNTIAAEAVVGW